MYGAQSVVLSALQLPLPPQVASSVAMPALQLATRQTSEVPGYWQSVRLLPSQLPPHAEPSVTHALREP
jgi:hypothetical protein